MSEVKSVESASGGVKIIGIAGRHVYEKERLAGMTAEDRIWRQKWLKDQCLTPREPLLISKSDPKLMNPIRRFYRAPLDILFFKVLQPVIVSQHLFYDPLTLTYDLFMLFYNCLECIIF